MRIGVCCGADRFEEIRNAGYDYGEMNLNMLAAMSQAEFDETRAQVAKSGIEAEAVNCFFGAGWHLTGPEVDYDAIREYAVFALGRASRLGCRVAVLGSGGARKVPEGFDRAIAGAQFAHVLQVCGDAAAQFGITIVLEPLNQSETNIVNGVETGAYFVQAADHPNVKLLVDFYHLFREDEPVSHVEKAGELLCHAHLARPNIDRKMPGEAELDVCRVWAEALDKAGYTGRLSLEGDLGEFSNEILRVKPALVPFREV